MGRFADADGGGSSAPHTWRLAASGTQLNGSAGGDFEFYDLVRSSMVVAPVAVGSDMAVL